MLRFLKSLPLLVNRNPWQKSQIIVIFLSQYRNIVCENVWCDEALKGAFSPTQVANEPAHVVCQKDAIQFCQ